MTERNQENQLEDDYIDPLMLILFRHARFQLYFFIDSEGATIIYTLLLVKMRGVRLAVIIMLVLVTVYMIYDYIKEIPSTKCRVSIGEHDITIIMQFRILLSQKTINTFSPA